METKFIKVSNRIINVNDIASIRTHGQLLIIECTNNTYNIYFASEREAEGELNRIYDKVK